MPAWLSDSIEILLAALLVLLNGFFVAAEFALVKARGSQLEILVREGRPFARTAAWLSERLDASLSACQLGITMASLGLGWVGEPAVADLLKPLLRAVGISSANVLHTSAFVIAFTAITAIHLVVGEQAPKIFAIRRPARMALWCAPPLMLFYILSYPLMVSLNASTGFLLRLAGVDRDDDHETPHTEDEIRELIHQSHAHGELTRSEHKLIHAVFEFDDLICRRVMVPRSDVVFFDVDAPIADCIELARVTQHTRYPLCEGALDRIIGIVHIKDFVGTDPQSLNLRSIARPAKRVPETMPVSRLLRHFQATHQLMAVVIDEHGTMVGIVTLENVLEPIVGPVEDEFDNEPQQIVPETKGQFLIRGTAPIDLINRLLHLDFDAENVDTFSGLLMTKLGDIPQPGDRVELDGATAEVLEVRGARATLVRVTVHDDSDEPAVRQ